jgi:hypothetical protein
MEKNLINEAKTNKKRPLQMILLAAVVLILIIGGNIMVWRGYFDKQGQVEPLKIEVAQVNQQLVQASEYPAGLNEELARLQAELAEALAVFPDNIDRNDVIDFILNTAEWCGVTVVPLVAEGVEPGDIGQASNTLKYHGTVTGTLSRTSLFMTMLHAGKYPSMIITQCSVHRITSQDEYIPTNDIVVAVDFEISFYVNSIKGE